MKQLGRRHSRKAAAKQVQYLRSDAPLMTWKLVTMLPFESQMNPDPDPCGTSSTSSVKASLLQQRAGKGLLLQQADLFRLLPVRLKIETAGLQVTKLAPMTHVTCFQALFAQAPLPYSQVGDVHDRRRAVIEQLHSRNLVWLEFPWWSLGNNPAQEPMPRSLLAYRTPISSRHATPQDEGAKDQRGSRTSST